jgi:multidrug resistance efflux pump
VNPRNKFFIILGVIFAIALGYYLFSTPRGSDLDLIGIVDANQVIVSPQTAGRISKLLIDEGTVVKQGDLIATLDPSELEAQARAAAATIDSLRSQVSATEATSAATQGSTSSSVVNAQARLESTRAQLLQAEATLQRVESDSRRAIELARQGVASQQESEQAAANLKAQQAVVASLQKQVEAAQADLNAAVANTHQAHAAQSTVASTRAQLLNAEAQLKEAEVRLGYTKIYAPVSGTVSVRAAREGEYLTPGQPIATIVDLGDTWVRASIPETETDHIGIGDTLRIRLPGGTVTSGKVF